MSMVIFLPVRNGGAYIRVAIDSIVAQHDPDWRLIVLENASSDATVATVEDYGDARITLVPADRPLGIYQNWHRIWMWLEEQKFANELVTTIGHDDALDPDFVGAMSVLAARHPDAGLYQSAFTLIDSAGDVIRPCKPVPQTETWQGLAAALCWGIRDSFGTGYVFRARDYRRLGGIPNFPNLLYSDHLLFIRLAQLGGKVATEEALCRYRLHLGSASNSFSRGTVNASVEALDGFVTVLTTELQAFANTELGRDAVACLIGRHLIAFDRPGIRDLLAPANRERLLRLKRLYATVSPTIAPETWAGTRAVRWIRGIRAIKGTAAFLRVRLIEGLGR